MICERGLYVLVGLKAERANKRSHWELSLLVDAHIYDAVRLCVDLDPDSASRDDLCAEVALSLEFVLRKEDTEGTCELRNDDALDSVNDERTVVGHHRKVREEDLLLFCATGELVRQADLHLYRRLIRQLVLLCVEFVALRLAKRKAGKIQLEFFTGIVWDRRELFEDFSQPVLHQLFERTHLHFEQIRELRERRLVLRKVLLRSHDGIFRHVVCVAGPQTKRDKASPFSLQKGLLCHLFLCVPAQPGGLCLAAKGNGCN